MIPNYKSEVEAAKAKYPEAWGHAHVEGDPRRLEFIKLLASDLNKKDPKVGLNGKRGNPNDLSADALNYLCDAADSAGRTPEGLPCAVVDCIFAAGAVPPYTPQNPAPAPIWSPFTTVVEGSGAWVKPGASVPIPPQPPQPPTTGYPYPDENTTVRAYQDRVKATYNEALRAFPDPNDSDAFRWFSRYGYSCKTMPEPEASNKHIAELRAMLGLP